MKPPPCDGLHRRLNQACGRPTGTSARNANERQSRAGGHAEPPSGFKRGFRREMRDLCPKPARTARGTPGVTARRPRRQPGPAQGDLGDSGSLLERWQWQRDGRGLSSGVQAGTAGQTLHGVAGLVQHEPQRHTGAWGELESEAEAASA